MSGGEAVFARVVGAIQPLLYEHGFRRVEQMDDQPAYGGTLRAAFAAGPEAVRLVWDEEGGYVVLEALEPEFDGSWTDMLLKHIDLPRATESELMYLHEILREELMVYFGQVER